MSSQPSAIGASAPAQKTVLGKRKRIAQGDILPDMVYHPTSKFLLYEQMDMAFQYKFAVEKGYPTKEAKASLLTRWGKTQSDFPLNEYGKSSIDIHFEEERRHGYERLDEIKVHEARLAELRAEIARLTARVAVLSPAGML